MRYKMSFFSRLSCLGIIGMLTCVIALGDQRTKSRQSKTDSKNIAAKDSESFLKFISQAAVDAANMLRRLNDPVFSTKEGISIQSLPEDNAALPILFTTVDSYPQNLRQELRRTYCQLNPIAGDSKTKFAVVCNLDNLRGLDVLIRIAHMNKFLANNMRNDWAFMQLLSRIERNPAAVLAEAKPAVVDSHISEHLTLLLIFLLAHESWHLQHQSSSSFTDTSDTEFDNDLQSLITCRNYHEFARRGKQLGGFTTEIIPLPDEGTAKDPTQRSYFTTTRAIWQQELEADQYAAGMLARVILLFRERGAAEAMVQHAFSEVVQNFAFLGLTLWHGRLQPFAEQACSKFAGKDFYLTLCMCEEKKRYPQVLRLFGATHPPIVLRMHSAAKEFGIKLGIDKDVNKVFPNAGPDVGTAIFWYNLIEALSDVPLKLAMPECVKLSDHTEQLIQVFPDLAGFNENRGSTVYPGYPANEDVYERECYSFKPKRSTKH